MVVDGSPPEVFAAHRRAWTPLDLFVARQPPPAARFFSQRVRQAYDDFAEPARLAAALAVLPSVVLVVARGRRRVRRVVPRAANSPRALRRRIGEAQSGGRTARISTSNLPAGAS